MITRAAPTFRACSRRAAAGSDKGGAAGKDGYVIRRAAGPITIDGKADEASWASAALR